VSACSACSRDLTDSIVARTKAAATVMQRRFGEFADAIYLLEEIADKAIGMRGVNVTGSTRLSGESGFGCGVWGAGSS